MLPFLCEITLCCIVSYHFALLVMKREPRMNRNSPNQNSERVETASRRDRAAARRGP